MAGFWRCLYGLITQHSIWYPVNLLAGVVVPGLGDATLQQLKHFNRLAFVAALIGHGILSVLVGIVYAVIMPMFPKYAPLWAGILMPLFWSGLVATSLSILNPALNDRISWPWFVLCQLAFGLVGGYVIARSTNIKTMQSLPLAARASLHYPSDETQKRQEMGVSPSRRMPRGGGVLPAVTMGLSLLCVTACEPPGKPGPAEIAPEDITDFTTLYQQNCSACHGPNGKNGPGRILNDPLYLAIIPRDTLKQVIQHGRPGTSMPAWDQRDGGTLSLKQIDALVNGIENNWAKPLKSSGAALPSYTGEGITGDAHRGQKLFFRDCFACHGQGAPVGTVTGGEFLSLVTDQVLRTSIIVGRPDLGMLDYRFLQSGSRLERSGHLRSGRLSLIETSSRHASGRE